MSFLLRPRNLTQPAFEEALRRVYSEALNEPVPQWANDLLARLK